MEFIIKKTDLAEIWHIRHKVMYPERKKEYVKLKDDTKGIHLGLYADSKLVSVISFFKEGEELQFRKFATLSKEQGKGYGSSLLNEVIKYAKMNNIKKIWCNSRIEKTEFYKKFGFVKTDREYLRDGKKFIIMEKYI